MQIRVDVSVVPPLVKLLDAEDLTSFSVDIVSPGHVWVSPDTVQSLAGETSSSPEWQEGFKKMVEYACSKGWVSPDGSIRAHVTEP